MIFISRISEKWQGFKCIIKGSGLIMVKYEGLKSERVIREP